MSRYCNYLGQIHENGKEKAHKAMSELLEKILSKDNMNVAYKDAHFTHKSHINHKGITKKTAML